MNEFIMEGHFSPFHPYIQEELEVEPDAEVTVLVRLILPE
jgi:hypothetical protein